MRAYEFITENILREYREDITKRQYGDAIIKQMLNGPDSRRYTQDLLFRSGPLDTRNYQSSYNTDKLLEEAFTFFGGADPTWDWYNKTGGIYIPWVAREYSKGNIKRLEDCRSYVPRILYPYHKYKNRKDFKQKYPEVLDIMKTNFDQLATVMERYEPQEELKDRGKSKTVYDGPDARVIVPENVQAACYYGQGTRWCTAATKGENYFDNYNKEGPLYILLPKKPELRSEKFQIHVQSNQYMDIKDEEVSLSSLKESFPGAMEKIAELEPKLKELVIFADPDVVVGIWNTLGDISVQRAKEISENEDFTDNYRESAKKFASILKSIFDKTYEEIMDLVEHNSNFKIPRLKTLARWEIEDVNNIDYQIDYHIVNKVSYYIDKSVDIGHNDDLINSKRYTIVKTIGDWNVIIGTDTEFRPWN